MRTRRQSAWTIFAIPAALAVATVLGLAAGLLGDAGWDAAAWLGLTVPLAAGWWGAARR